MLLVILSPLAFVCYAFPKTKQIFDKWWNQFIQWAFIGVMTAFFMYLAGHLIQGFGLGKAVISPSSLDFWVPTAFLLFAYSLIFQTSALGAGAAIGLATGAVGFAGGAIRGTTKFAGKRAWNSRAGQKARRGLTRVGEGLGVVAPGTANLMQQKHLQEHESEKRAATWSVEQRKALATGRTPITRRGRNDKVEAIKQMAEKGELGSLNHTELQSAMAYIKSSGVPAKVLAEKDYRAAGHDEKRVEAYRATHGFTNGLPTTMDDSRRAVRSEQLSENLSKMNGKQLRNITATDLELDPHNSDSHDMIREQFTPNMAKQFKTADPDRRAALLSHVGAVGVPNTLENDIHIATDPREKTRLTKLKDSIIKATT
jgi:hypothetical protein